MVYNACYAAPACGTDDGCLARAGLAVGGSSALRYSADCVDKLSACSVETSDRCSTGVFALTGVAEAARTCLTKPCGELAACFDAIERDLDRPCP